MEIRKPDEHCVFPGDNAMNKQEFIKLAVSSGYGTKSAAEHYTEKHNKSEYSTDDFISLYHTSMHWSGVAAHKGLRPVYNLNGKTTAFNGIRGNSGSGQDWR